MAKPRVFISSTFYDLRQVRQDLDQFIMSLGYEPIRNEEGDIPYGKDAELEKYCYDEIKKLRYIGVNHRWTIGFRIRYWSIFDFSNRIEDGS